LDFPVARHKRQTKGENGAAAVLAALLRFDHGTAAGPIHLVHKNPRVPVRHIHGPARSGNRPAGTNILKQFDFAVSDVLMHIQIDAKDQ
jgi:hypothetical protein